MSLDYKAKYKELKAQMLRSTDLAYRLGYEQGTKDAQMENMQMQMQQQQQMMAQQAAMAQGAQPGQEGQPMSEEEAAMQQEGAMPMEGEEEGPEMAQAPVDEGEEMEPGQVSELDNYINELESLVAKGEKPSVVELRKRVTDLANLRKSQKAKMKANRPQIVSAQKKLVDSILKKWENESKMTAENLENLINTEGLKLE